MASSQRQAQEAVRGRGDPRCPNHRSKNVVYMCQDCKTLVCMTCVTSLHRKHAFDEICDIIPDVQSKIQNYVTSTEQDEIPRIKAEIKKGGENQLKSRQYYNDLISEVEKQREILKSELDETANGLIQACLDIAKGGEDLFDKYKRDLQTMIDELNAKIRDFKDALCSKNNICLVDIATLIPSKYKAMPTTESYRLSNTTKLIQDHKKKWFNTIETLENLEVEIMRNTKEVKTLEQLSTITMSLFDDSTRHIMKALNMDPNSEEAKKEYRQLIDNQNKFEKEFPDEFKKHKLTDVVRLELMARTSNLKPKDHPNPIYKSLFHVRGQTGAQQLTLFADGLIEYFYLRHVSEMFKKIGEIKQHVTKIPIQNQASDTKPAPNAAENEPKPPQENSKSQKLNVEAKPSPHGSPSQKKKNIDETDGRAGGEKARVVARVIYKEVVVIPEGHMLVKTTDYHKLQIDLRNSRESVEELSSRLSAIASSKLKDGNPNIADLSKIGEQFGSLYDDEWSEAFEHLSGGDESKYEDAILFLMNIIKETYLFCANVSGVQTYHLAEVFRDHIVRPYIPDMDQKGYPAIKTDDPSEEDIKSAYGIGQKFAKDLRKQGAMYSMDTLKQVYRHKVLKAKFKQDLESINPTIVKYAEKCFQLLWLMAVQDPPMEIRWAIENERVDVNYYKFYESKGRFVKLSVWPAVFLCNEGAIICKGYVVGGAAPNSRSK